jgi:hypothetical protein
MMMKKHLGKTKVVYARSKTYNTAKKCFPLLQTRIIKTVRARYNDILTLLEYTTPPISSILSFLITSTGLKIHYIKVPCGCGDVCGSFVSSHNSQNST